MTFFPRSVALVRGMRPFAFKLEVAVKPMDSPRRQRFKICRSRSVGLYLQTLRVPRFILFPLLLMFSSVALFACCFALSFATALSLRFALRATTTTACKLQSTSTTSVLHLSTFTHENRNGCASQNTKTAHFLATEILQRLDPQTTAETQTRNSALWCLEYHRSQSLYRIRHRQRRQDQTLLLHKAMEFSLSFCQKSS